MPSSGPCRGTQRVAVVGFEVAANPDGDLLPAPAEAPAFGLRPVGVAQAVVVGEIARLCRCAGAGEIGRCCGADEAGGGEPARDQAAVGQPADPHRKVEALFEQVDDAVVQGQLEADRRVRGQEFRYKRAQIRRKPKVTGALTFSRPRGVRLCSLAARSASSTSCTTRAQWSR